MAAVEPIGACQPCPIDEIGTPVCAVYHNRRLVDCVYLGSSSPALIASVLRPPSVFATGLIIHHPSIDPALSGVQEGDQSGPPARRALASSHQADIGAGLGAGEFQTWEACERVVLKEQQDFYEFVLCNLAIAVVSLVVYGFRTKQLVIKQYGRLAARIGILPS
ncbi:hypothetical protein PtA15_5A221 [Puccinia triticina]|uniref:CDR ABC transporter domain-containing protein n=1 Tax=Puccinia triticina TaxID=208348 RepID=A0ABY7CIA2_9BASI|nr:uncharacterized protein PtA15_5A221 [Puccinia triticina]WAQ84648.1 hypothetical protein PtA15_5A221 [Puccinia triticina]